MNAAQPRLAVEVVTLFPDAVRAAVAMGVVGRALERGLVRVGIEDPRSLATDVHRTVDDRPYGGGPGMVLKVEPLAQALERAAGRLPPGSPRIYLSAQGRRFDQAAARRLAALPGFVLLAGRYEGIDERVLDEAIDEQLSIGDYVLSGGELAALVVIDATVRLVPGVLGASESAEQESFGAASGGLLDWPHYTRPEVWRERQVPDVLTSGDHAAIRRWRLKQALGRTFERRPDLMVGRELTSEERALLDEYREERKS
ncbi:MAG TPA: tRNA (guanosine(37)-N1)-methyltransferase TrmD [Steroidobacteraceae bacterium]|nr:tRNA (guanosine(37)-N1)-methyltransferase TrmD [Steroidobacteraceae bacterium]